MSKQIEEVMELVELFGDECEACGHGAGMDTYQAILAKLRELLPGWQPIETAPKDGTWIDVWIGDERLADVFWGQCHQSRVQCWVTLQFDDCFGWVSRSIDHLPTHWMRHPKAPE